MKLRWSETSKQDLIEIWQYIANDNPKAAKRWVNRLKARARKTVDSPYAGRIVPEFSRDSLREVIEGNYRIVYHIAQDVLIIVTIFESHRLFPTAPDT